MLVGFLLMTILGLPLAGAWGNGGYSADPLNPDYGTHDWIAEMALSIQTADVTFLSTTYRIDYLLGTEAPDNSAYIGDQFNHHVYYYASGSLQDDVGAVRARAMYNEALGYLRSGDHKSAAFSIGAMTAYIADLGVFGHTMGASTDWGAEVHHSDYEDWIETRIGGFDPPSGISLFSMDAYDVTLALAGWTTFGSGPIQSNAWMDANYDWANPTFKVSAFASLNASVQAVAAALNHLLSQAPVPIPEFGAAAPLVPLMLVVLLLFMTQRRSLRRPRRR